MQTEPTQPAEERPSGIARWEWAVLALAILLGAVVRVWFVQRVPGLWYDEAINGLDALRIIREPGWPIFFDTRGHMREPMFMYLETLGVLLGGTTSVALRAVATVVGIVTIPVVWLLAREMRGAAFAAVAVCLFAMLRWHIHFSGLAFRTILAPLFASLVMLFFLRMVPRNSRADAVACGIALGLGAYTYLAFRLMPLVLLVPMLWCLYRHPLLRGRLLRLYGIVIAVAFVVFLPLGINYLKNPQHFTGRGSEVRLSDHGNPALLLLRQARDVALMPLLRGDHVGKHNIPGPPRFFQMFVQREDPPEDTLFLRWRDAPGVDPHGTGIPAFPPLTGLLFYLGFVVVVIASRRDLASVCLLSWLLIGSLASVLSFGAPNMLRMQMLTPAATVLIVAGGWCLWGSLASGNRRLAAVLLGIIALVHAGTELHRLRVWTDHPMAAREFNAELAAVADYLRAQPDRLPVRMAFDEQPTLSFLADGYQWNPAPEQLSERWWELYLGSLEPIGTPFPGSRVFPVVHPIHGQIGNLVEVSPAPAP